MARAGHVTDEELAELDDAQGRVRDHVLACEVCRRRREEVFGLREVLADAGQRERRPRRDVVPSAMMRLRLRRHSVTNANELLVGFAALVRGLASLFSLPTDRRSAGRPFGSTRGVEDEQHE